MPVAASEFIRLMKHPVKFRVFLFLKLPAAFLAGVRVKHIDVHSCTTTIPYKWLSQNPFRSTYFACLAMAAEMSTGALAMAHLHKRKPPVSMLVTKLSAEYYKKAVGLTAFTCEDGDALNETIERAVSSGEGQEFTATSTGRNEAGEVVAVFRITWSFKAKKSVSAH
ncbi:MAG: DUF4442 domain-containing protein [Bacteroidetes bacterium]|nr:DUF4442 domain-containing protein [Bacteroidota bacterium]